MLVPQQSLQIPIGAIQNIPTQVLAELVSGQRLDVVVSKTVNANETVSIKIGDSQIEFKTPIALRAGQTIQLELIQKDNQTLLQLITAKDGISTIAKLSNLTIPSPLSLKVGQTIAVEVVKLLAENRLLVQSSINVPNGQSAKPQQFDIDISKLPQRYQQGDDLQIKIVSVKPLQIQIQPIQNLSRERIIADKIQTLLPQQAVSSRLDSISKMLQQQQLPDKIQQSLQTLIKHTIDKSQITQADSFKQAVAASGVEMERKLLSQPNKSNQDFKANISKVLLAVETVIGEMKSKLDDSAINKLPAQVQSALLAKGKTPAQLMSILLSAQGKGFSTPQSLSSSLITSQQQAISLVQLLNKPLIAQPQQMAELASKAQGEASLRDLGQLFREVEGVHNKLQLNQLMMLKEPDIASNTTASWLFDVPIKDKQSLDLLKLQIDQQKQSNQDDDDDHIWNVKLRLDTQNLGPIQATLTLHHDDVKIVLRAERSESAQLLTEHLNVLDEALIKLGVSMSHSSCHCGKVGPFELVENSSSQHITIASSLLDISV